MSSPRSVIAAGLTFLAAAAILVLWLRSSYDAPPSSPLNVPQWHTQPSFQNARRAHAAATDGEFVYVLGGVNDDGNYVPSVEYSRIGRDAALNPWQITQPLAEPRFYLGAAIIGKRVYVVGGATGDLGDDNIPSASVHSAPIGADGALGTWRREAYLTTPRRGLQVVASHDRIYAIGGYNGVFLRSVEFAEPDAEGRIEHWSVAAHEADVERYMHAAALAAGRLYVLTGHIEGRSGMGYASIESAAIDPDGQIGPWRSETAPVSRARFLSSAVGVGNALYLLGGHDGTQRLASVEVSIVGREGSPGPWRGGVPMQSARSATAVVATDSAIYVLGGSGTDGALSTVESLIIH